MTAPLLLNLQGKTVYVAGHTGMAGSAIVRRLEQEDCEVLVADRDTVDLTNQGQTEEWLTRRKPEVVIIAAGRVGGDLCK